MIYFQQNINQTSTNTQFSVNLNVVILGFVEFVVLIQFIYIFVGFYSEITVWSPYLNMFVRVQVTLQLTYFKSNNRSILEFIVIFKEFINYSHLKHKGLTRSVYKVTK